MHSNTPELPQLHLQQQDGTRPLLCLHSSSASAGQWRTLAACLQGRHRLLLPDLAGHGRSPAWPTGLPHSLAAEAESVWAALPRLQAPLDIVAHSYGGALALQMAVQRPAAVRSLTLYEPVLFGLLRRHEPWGEAWREIAGVARAVGELVAAGRPAAAGQLFCNYWHEAPAWQLLNAAQQASVSARMAMVDRHFQALFEAGWAAAELGRLDMPLRLICGSRTRASARRVCELLALALPQTRLSQLTGAGHLGPISHASGFAGLVEEGLHRPAAQACV